MSEREGNIMHNYKQNKCTKMIVLVGMFLILGTTLVLGASHIYSILKLNGEEV